VLSARRVREVRLHHYGNDSDAEALVAKLVVGWDPEFVITTGDNNYYEGSAATIDVNIGKYYARFIGDYTGAYGPGSPANRFWPSAGNHDWGSPDLAAYRSYFTLPGNERYYDFRMGPVHFFIVDSEDNINRFLPTLDEMMTVSGLITLEKVQVHQYGEKGTG